MSIYRRYVSAFSLGRIALGEDVAITVSDKSEPGYHHPIYITVPDEDAPEPPEIPDVPRRTGSGHAVSIVSPPVWDITYSSWVVLGRCGAGGAVGSFVLSRLTPIEPAPERATELWAIEKLLDDARSVACEGAKHAERYELANRQAGEALDRMRKLLARLEGSDAPGGES